MTKKNRQSLLFPQYSLKTIHLVHIMHIVLMLTLKLLYRLCSRFISTEDYRDLEQLVTGNETSGSTYKNSRRRSETNQKPARKSTRSSHGFQLKRHVGVPDHGGYQRLIATGGLVTSLGEENNTGPSDSIDVVFTTYWQYPAKVRIILPEDKACIEKHRKLIKQGE